MKNQGFLRDPLGQLVEQVIRRLLGCLFRRNVYQLFWRYHVAHCLPLAALADKDERVNAVVLLVGKAVRNRERTDRLRRIRMTAEELFHLIRVWGIRWALSDRLQQITAVLPGSDREELERVGHHVGVTSTRPTPFNADPPSHRT